MSKFGFSAKEVINMSHAEVSSWITSYFDSQGIKPKATNDNTTTYIFERRKKGA